MQILPYDYIEDAPDMRAGLVQLADQIDAFRAEPDALTLLFDNGDFLQGNPVADTIAQAGPRGAVHPMIAAFTALRYDAVALGNHEFNYGLTFLQNTLKDAPFPVLCANIDWQDQTACAIPYALLKRQMRCDDGSEHTITIGVVGFVPPQVTQWDRVALNSAIRATDIVETATRIIPDIKARGADIIVALCHAGIGPSDHIDGMENAAVPLAAVPGIDVILTGHTHDVFPDASRAPAPYVDPAAGRLHGKPAVGAGFHGNALGVISLDLVRNAGGWQIAGHESRLIPAATGQAQSLVSRQISDATQADHAATLARIRQPVALTVAPINSFFARVCPDLPSQILGAALIDYAENALPGMTQPVIAAVSPFRAGGRAGPGHFVQVAPGPVTLRDISGIYPYADMPVVVRRTGRHLRDWLEQAVSGYYQVRPGQSDRPLLDPLFAAYVFDAFCGLTYAIDLTQPPRHDATGKIIDKNTRRIMDLRHHGQEVGPDDVFAVVVNSYRAFGGGGFAEAPAQDILYLSHRPVHEILTSYLRAQQTIDLQPDQNWRFVPISQASAVFKSSPHGQHHLPEAVRHVGAGEGGFHIYEITF